MTYLLAKYTLLFLLTAFMGFLLGYWFSRRNIVDVTENFEDLRNANNRSDAAQWDRLWTQLNAIPEPKETNLSGVYERLDNVSRTVSRLPEPSSLAPVEMRLDSLETAVNAIPIPLQPEPVDLEPVTRQLGILEQRVSTLPRPQSVNLAPFDHRLKSIEIKLDSIGERFREPEADIEPRSTSDGEPRILKAALYGNKDNLQSISGVGPKLEQLLNHNGVFYFWQVASWSDQDIDVIDDRLDVFRGRIARDDWVSQAKRLRSQPDAARMPTD